MFAFLSWVALAASPVGLDGDAFQIKAKEVVLADGSRIADGVVVVTDGKITRVGAGDADPNLPTLEHDGVLTAGLIACQTRSGGASETVDVTRPFLSDARLVYAFDPSHSDFDKALAAGITSVVLTPADINVAGGVTAVVKTAGGAIVAREAHLALSFSAQALGYSAPRPRFIFGSVDANGTSMDEGGPEVTYVGRRGTRAPTSYGGAVRALGARFEEAGADANSERPLARAAHGDLPVFFEAWSRNEVARAVGFAQKHALQGALRGATLASDPGLLPQIVASGLAVVVGPFRTGHARRSLDAVRALQDAGVKVGFALDAPENDPQAFRLSAAMAVGSGADRTAVLQSLTNVAAEIAGVDARVGSIERGKDADFVLWSGDPLNLTSRVEAVYVDGALAWSADRSAD